MPRISEEERHHRSHVLFESHRERQLATHFPENSLVDLRSSVRVDCWGENPTVVRRLTELLPFGTALLPGEYEDFISNTLSQIPSAAQDQLLYWHLADHPMSLNYPIESILLWNNDTYLWSRHFPPRERDITFRILNGERVHFLEQVRLDHAQIQVTFQEIRLITQEDDHTRPVITEGRELTYRWLDNRWEISLDNPDQRLINPRVFHFPQEDLEEEEPTDLQRVFTAPEITEPSRNTFHEQLREEIRQEQAQELLLEESQEQLQEESLPVQEQLLEESLPPSTAPYTPRSDVGWESTSQWGFLPSVCWCNKEVCDCGYRPDTPPTPPSVVLWAPGQTYLPAR